MAASSGEGGVPIAGIEFRWIVVNNVRYWNLSCVYSANSLSYKPGDMAK